MTDNPDDRSNSPLKTWVRALEMTAPIAQHPYVTLPVVIESLAERFDSALAIIAERECLTYRGLAGRSNQCSHWALEQGLSRGDVVCLLMPNCPEYMAVWLGITRIGATVSLVNTNLTGKSLAHSVNIVEPKHVIVGAELADTFPAVGQQLGLGVQCWVHGESSHGFRRIDEVIQRYPRYRLHSSERKPLSIQYLALYIYTSATTCVSKDAN